MFGKRGLLLFILIMLLFSFYIVQAEENNLNISHRVANSSDVLNNIVNDLNVSEFVSIYNQGIAGKSRIVDSIFGNERINFYLDRNLSFGVVTSGGKIVDYNKDGVIGTTLNVYMKREDLLDLINRNLSIEDALTFGKIEYHGVGFVKATKFWALHLIQIFVLGSGKIEKKQPEKKCVDSDGPLDQNSSHISGVCTDITGKSYYDTCALIEQNSPYKKVVDYDCNSNGYCVPKDWWCATANPVNECEKGACVPCPGSDSECVPSSPFTENGLSVPEPPKLANLS